MSVRAVTWALHLDINPSQKVVLIAIADSANDQGEKSFPGQKKIAEIAKMSDRNVRRILCQLEDDGYLSRMPRHRQDGSRTSDEYKLHFDCAEQAENDAQIKTLPDNMSMGVQDKLSTGVQPDIQGMDNRTTVSTQYKPNGLSEPSVEPSVKTREENRPDSKILFDQFWKEFPNRKGKKQAGKKFNALLKASKSPNKLHREIMAGLERYKQHKPLNQSWLHPSTFLNNERWADEYTPNQGMISHGQQSYHNSEPSVSTGLAEAVARLTSEQRTPNQAAHTGPTIDLERDRSTGEGSGNANYH